MHTATDGERDSAIIKRITFRRNISAIDGIEVHLRETAAIVESVTTNRGHGITDGQRARQAVAIIESKITN